MDGFNLNLNSARMCEYALGHGQELPPLLLSCQMSYIVLQVFADCTSPPACSRSAWSSDSSRVPRKLPVQRLLRYVADDSFTIERPRDCTDWPN